MPKTGKNIYKRKDGRWEGRYTKERYSNGKILYGSVYGKTCKEVKQRLASFSISALSSTLPAESSVKRHASFSNVTIKWLSVISLKVKPSTYAEYTAMLSLHILPLLGKRKVQDLTAVDISLFAKMKLENGRSDGKGGLSVKRVRDILSIVKAIVDFAYSEHIINSKLKITYPKLQQRTMRVLTRQEQTSLEMVLTANLDIYKLGILLCLYTGIRIGEVCALRWQDISADFDTLSIRQTLQRVKNTDEEGGKTRILIDSPKSQRSVREIPIPKFISSCLRSFVSKNRQFFLATKDILHTEPRTMQNHFARSTKAANIKDANFHTLRHTFATRCIEAGVDIKSLSEMLGHASVNITLNRYVHSSFDQKREGMNKLEKFIGI
jgi:integrase